MTTIAEIAAEVADEFGEDYTGNAEVKTQWDRWAIEAVEEVIASGRWFSSNNQNTITTVSGTATYTQPATTAEIRSIEKPGGGKLPYTTVDRLIARSKSLVLAGIPTSWYIDGISATQEVVIGMQPVPNAVIVYEAFVLDKPPVLADVDTIPLGPEFERPIRYFIRAKGKYNDNQLDAYQAAKDEGTQALALLNSRFVDAPKQGSRLPATQLKETAQLQVAKG